MKITSLKIRNFKSLSNIDIELGRLNVFIGPNGTGKTSILEALGIISATMSDKMEDIVLKLKGVRLGTPYLYKSSFKGENAAKLITFYVSWLSDSNESFTYNFSVGSPLEGDTKTWRFFSELLKSDTQHERIFGRSNHSGNFIEFDDIHIPNDRSMYGILKGALTKTIIEKRIDWNNMDILRQLKDYAIYTPNALVLRGLFADDTTKNPVGLLGGRLAEATSELLRENIKYRKSKYSNDLCNKLLYLNDWYYKLAAGIPNQNIVSSNINTPRRVLRFKDSYMNDNRNIITAHDASEGALHSIFLACLLFHPCAPKTFAVDNFDYGLNPRAAREAAKIFSKALIGSDKTVLLTTHNPLVLDGLDIQNEEVKLFTVDRDRAGKTFVEQVKVDSKILNKPAGVTLSSLWLSGRLGGMPNL